MKVPSLVVMEERPKEIEGSSKIENPSLHKRVIREIKEGGKSRK